MGLEVNTDTGYEPKSFLTDRGKIAGQLAPGLSDPGYDPYQTAISNLSALKDNRYASGMAADMGMQEALRERSLTDQLKLANITRANELTDFGIKEGIKNQFKSPTGTSIEGWAMGVVNSADKDPLIKNTPAYKRAMQVLTRPKFFQTAYGLETQRGLLPPPVGGSNVNSVGKSNVNPVGKSNVNPVGKDNTLQTGPILKPRKWNRKIDDQFTSELTKFVTDAPNIKTNLNKLRGVIKILGSGRNITGPALGATAKISEMAFKRFNPEAANAKSLVESVAQQSLKLILGGQFGIIEGQQLIERAYDPSLEEKYNVQRLEYLVQTIEDGIKARQKMATYYSENGTLEGLNIGGLFSFDAKERSKAAQMHLKEMDKIGPNRGPSASIDSLKPAGIDQSVWDTIKQKNTEEDIRESFGQ
tara:strand:- start:2656 stop:3903 length:1248 start_codon:yes stop_codon:yes gene_type:complete